MSTATQALEAFHFAHRPRPTQGGRAARVAIERATTLACMVRDESPDTTGAYLDALTTDQTYALIVALAAMVPIDQPATELLGWLEPLGRRLELEAQHQRAVRVA